MNSNSYYNLLRQAAAALMLLALARALASADPPAVRLIVLPAAVYDAGALDPLGPAHLTHTFLLRNDGTLPIVIEDLSSSCGCTTALPIAGSRTRELPVRLAPGQSVHIQMDVDVEAGITGSLEKYVWVQLAGQSDPGATLEIKAAILPVVVFSPTTLDFGRLRSGDEKQLTLYALVSPALKARNLQLSLTGTLPYMKISSPVAAGFAPAPNGIKGKWPRLQFTVTLEKSAPICSFAADLQAEVHGIGLGDDPSGLLATIYAVAQGKIVGDISSAPTSLVFGTVRAGQGATRSITINGVTPGVLTKLTVASASPWVQVAPAASADGNSRRYSVTVRGSAPMGSFSTKITFATASGQALEVPILAYVANNVEEPTRP